MKESTLLRLFWCSFACFLVLRWWSAFRGPPVTVVVDDDDADIDDVTSLSSLVTKATGAQKPVERDELKQKKVRIYVYELGAGLQPWLNETEEIGQYSLGNVVFERLVDDPRRTLDPSKATLFVVPLDLSRFTFGEGKLEPPEICRRVMEAKRIVELSKAADEHWRPWSSPKSYSERFGGIDHVVPVARVASSMYWGWGKSCAGTFDWLRSMQWVTIEPPYSVDMKTGEAEVDLSDKPPMGGASRHHIVPYTTGVRLRSEEDLTNLRLYQRYANRTYLVSQSIGDHSRKGSSLRTNLKLACSRLSPGVCATDWRTSRSNSLARNRKMSRNNPLKNFEHWLIHATPHVALYASSTFCIQPPGITPTRAAVYQCLLAGSIPVFFETFLVDALDPLFNPNPLPTTSSGQDVEELPTDTEPLPLKPWAVVVSTKRATNNPFAEVYGKLARMDKDLIDDMRRTISRATPRLQYSLLGSGIYGDAYDYAIARAAITAENGKANGGSDL